MAAGTVALVVAFLALLAWDVLSIRWELEAGRDGIDSLTLEAASTTGLTTLAQGAAEHLYRAADISEHSLALRALSIVPGLDDQVRALRRMTDVTATLGGVGRQAAERLDARLEAAGEPAGRIALLDTALEELDHVDSALDRVDLGPTRGLLPPLRRAHDDLAHSLTRARAKLDDGRELIVPVRDMLAGPSTFLLLAANNAEMAGGSGLALSAGVLTFTNGDIDLGQVIPASDLRLPASVPLPGDLAQIYSPTGVGIDMRSSTRSPNLPEMGPIITEMMARNGLPDLDGVLVIDAVALADVMEISGPVDVAGKAIDADNVLDEVLHANYLDYDTLDERADRVSYQGDIAKAVFESLTTRDISPAQLADALLTAAEGRHLMLWASSPELQSVWEELSVAGQLDERGLMVSFQNYASNKLDWYLRPRTALDVSLLPSGDYRARLTMTMRLPARDELTDASAYTLGPGPEAHGLFLTAYLPAAAYDITTTDPTGFRTKGLDPPLQVRTFLVDVPLGTTFERTIYFSLPRKVSAVLLLPSARVEPMPVTIDGAVTVDDSRPIGISWQAASPGVVSSGVSLWVQAIVVAGLAATAAAAVALGLALRARRRAETAWRPGRWSGLAVALGGASLVCFVLAGLVALALHAPRA